jgi:outer membrane protein insertion porin family
MPKLLRLVPVLLFCVIASGKVLAQQPAANDTIPTAIDPALEEMINSKNAKEYNLAGIKVTGLKRYDELLLISISGLSVGDKIVYPGGDNFSKAIMNLWNQKLFSNIQIFFIKLDGRDLYIEVKVEERPALSNLSLIHI